MLEVDEIPDGDYRKGHPVGSARLQVDGGGPRRDHSRVLHVEVAQGIGADDEIPIDVEGFVGTDDGVPVARDRVGFAIASPGVGGPGEVMADEDGVIFGGGEPSIGLVSNPDPLERRPTDKFQTVQFEGLFLDNHQDSTLVTGSIVRRPRGEDQGITSIWPVPATISPIRAAASVFAA